MTSMILTPTGYRDVTTLVVGDEVSAFDLVTGAPIVNQVEGIDLVGAKWPPAWWVIPLALGGLAVWTWLIVALIRHWPF